MKTIVSTCLCVAILAAGSVCAAESTADTFLFPGGNIYVGADYYPEHWPEERWETDLRMMRDAGFNVVRVAEFSWVRFEPSEGQFDFSWLDRWLELAKKYDVKVILGTPTAIMPAWLAKKYPEALSQKADGTRTVWGGRRHNCFSDADYHRLAERIVRKMGEHYAHHPSIVGWQIDNELGGNDCRCDQCRTALQAWLKTRYGSFDEINRAWGTHFWGQRFHAWDEIPIPDMRVGDWAISNPSAALDWQRFTSQQSVDFLTDQVNILHETCPRTQFITHNFMGLHSSIDYYRLAKPLDFVSWDNYPKLSPSLPYDSSLSADVMRGLKKQNFLIMEQTAGPLGWSVFSRSPQPGELRKICYQQLAHGANGQIWFRWRSCTVGREQYWHGLLGHDGKAGRRYREAAQVAKEYHQLAPRLAGTTVKAEVAIIYDYDSIWAIQIQNGYPGASHAEAIERYYDALFRAGVNVDVLQPGDELSGYKLVLTPHLHVLADDVANQLTKYVHDGGVLLADCRTAVKDETNLAYARTLPGLLSPVLGIKIEEYESLRQGIQDKDEVTYKFRTDGLAGGEFTAIRYADWITPTTATPIARYEAPHLASYAATTRNQFGTGVGWYVGTIVDDTRFYDQLIARLFADAKIKPLVEPPPGIEVSVRSGEDRALLFVINHTERPVTVNVPLGRNEILSGNETGDTLKLDAFGVAVIELHSTDLTSEKRTAN
jgi:beta-galactosidase